MRSKYNIYLSYSDEEIIEKIKPHFESDERDTNKCYRIILDLINFRKNKVLRYIVSNYGFMYNPNEGLASPYEYAVITGNYDALKFLNEKCPMNEYKNDYALACAVSDSAPIRVIKWLITETGNIEDRNANGLTALQWAFQRHNLEAAKLLIDAGANIDSISDLGMTCLYQAAAGNFFDGAELLLKHGARVDLTEYVTPFSIACSMNHLPIAELLLSYGADIDFRDQNGMTALFLATVKKEFPLISFLKQHGASENIADCDGTTLRDLNHKEIREEIYRLLFEDEEEDESDGADFYILIHNMPIEYRFNSIWTKDNTQCRELLFIVWYTIFTAGGANHGMDTVD